MKCTVFTNYVLNKYIYSVLCEMFENEHGSIKWNYSLLETLFYTMLMEKILHVTMAARLVTQSTKQHNIIDLFNSDV